MAGYDHYRIISIIITSLLLLTKSPGLTKMAGTWRITIIIAVRKRALKARAAKKRCRVCVCPSTHARARTHTHTHTLSQTHTHTHIITITHLVTVCREHCCRANYQGPRKMRGNGQKVFPSSSFFLFLFLVSSCFLGVVYCRWRKRSGKMTRSFFFLFFPFSFLFLCFLVYWVL